MLLTLETWRRLEGTLLGEAVVCGQRGLSPAATAAHQSLPAATLPAVKEGAEHPWHHSEPVPHRTMNLMKSHHPSASLCTRT